MKNEKNVIEISKADGCGIQPPPPHTEENILFGTRPYAEFATDVELINIMISDFGGDINTVSKDMNGGLNGIDYILQNQPDLVVLRHALYMKTGDDDESTGGDSIELLIMVIEQATAAGHTNLYLFVEN